ncbi:MULTISPECIES: Rieske 2Fe-2S domain-containing protein [Roseivirga]|jgi:Rieske Fe-S protein|uniref:(Fe-S)-binding protein n=1 Tax=Roseivirga thermotolerans TaxID=1758176 RepID=A0ABQ3I7K2_9BACT|nr:MULTISPECIES: Rieske 2Fe-2S domain-containing protein [Roseivirga]MEC7755627.1 Rieske 2Fe-2S domain-containing protein [Bacteroidota bacterium]GHE71261.1 (Fe-S)-binding protein [Roseivirga thermotolerans]|tara:strand:+ start:320 stop:751 length:432 start_codon:yes stop_codon:yes gene_type:complete
MDRKEFLKNASAATALAFFGLSLESCSSDQEDTTPGTGNPPASSAVTFNITENPFNALQSEGGWLLHPSENILLVNVGGQLSAFGSRCTHTGCTRDWTFPNNVFQCNCHGSQFDTNGQVVNGPASSPLTKLSVSVNGDIVTVG